MLFLSVTAGPHPLVLVPDHENTACRRVAPVAPNAKFPRSPWGCPTHSPLFSCSPTSAERCQLLSVHSVCSCRNASSTSTSFPHVTAQPGPSLTQHHQNDITNIPAPNSIPPRICNSHHSQVPSQRPPRTPPAKCQKKGVPQSGINPPPLPPDRKHLYPTHAPAPCRRAVPFPSDMGSTNQPHFFFFSFVSHTREELQARMHARHRGRCADSTPLLLGRQREVGTWQHQVRSSSHHPLFSSAVVREVAHLLTPPFSDWGIWGLGFGVWEMSKKSALSKSGRLVVVVGTFLHF